MIPIEHQSGGGALDVLNKYLPGIFGAGAGAEKSTVDFAALQEQEASTKSRNRAIFGVAAALALVAIGVAVVKSIK